MDLLDRDLSTLSLAVVAVSQVPLAAALLIDLGPDVVAFPAIVPFVVLATAVGTLRGLTLEIGRLRALSVAAGAVVFVSAGLLYLGDSAVELPWSDGRLLALGVTTVAGGVGVLTGEALARSDVTPPTVDDIGIPRPVPLVVPFALGFLAMFVPVESIARVAATVLIDLAIVTAGVVVGVQLWRAAGASRFRKAVFAAEAIGAVLVMLAVYGGLTGTITCSLAYGEGFEVSYDIADNRFEFGNCHTRPNREMFGVGALLLVTSGLDYVFYSDD